MLVSISLCCLLSCDAYLLHLEPFLLAFSASTGLAGLGLGRGRICHVDVRHYCVMYRSGGGCGELVGVEALEVERGRL